MKGTLAIALSAVAAEPGSIQGQGPMTASHTCASIELEDSEHVLYVCTVHVHTIFDDGSLTCDAYVIPQA